MKRPRRSLNGHVTARECDWPHCTVMSVRLQYLDRYRNDVALKRFLYKNRRYCLIPQRYGVFIPITYGGEGAIRVRITIKLGSQNVVPSPHFVSQ